MRSFVVDGRETVPAPSGPLTLRRVLVPYDGSALSLEVLAPLKTLLGPFDATLDEAASGLGAPASLSSLLTISWTCALPAWPWPVSDCLIRLAANSSSTSRTTGSS